MYIPQLLYKIKTINLHEFPTSSTSLLTSIRLLRVILPLVEFFIFALVTPKRPAIIPVNYTYCMYTGFLKNIVFLQKCDENLKRFYVAWRGNGTKNNINKWNTCGLIGNELKRRVWKDETLVFCGSRRERELVFYWSSGGGGVNRNIFPYLHGIPPTPPLPPTYPPGSATERLPPARRYVARVQRRSTRDGRVKLAPYRRRRRDLGRAAARCHSEAPSPERQNARYLYTVPQNNSRTSCTNTMFCNRKAKRKKRGVRSPDCSSKFRV